MEGVDDVFGEPNGAAYVKREERVGPPLSYVQEKLVGSLKSLHALARALAEDDSLVDRLLGYQVDEFRDWIDRVQAGSSVAE